MKQIIGPGLAGEDIIDADVETGRAKFYLEYTTVATEFGMDVTTLVIMYLRGKLYTVELEGNFKAGDEAVDVAMKKLLGRKNESV